MGALVGKQHSPDEPEPRPKSPLTPVEDVVREPGTPLDASRRPSSYEGLANSVASVLARAEQQTAGFAHPAVSQTATLAAGGDKETLGEILRRITDARAAAKASPDHKTANVVLNQAMLRAQVKKARGLLEVALAVPGATADLALTPMRQELLAVLEAAMAASQEALSYSADLVDKRDSEREGHERLLAALIDAAPMTSARLAGMKGLRDVEAAAGTRQLELIERVLDELLAWVPVASLTPEERRELNERMLDGLRRAFVTVRLPAPEPPEPPGPAEPAAGAASTSKASPPPQPQRDLRDVDDDCLRDKVLRVQAMLVDGMASRPDADGLPARPQMELITINQGLKPDANWAEGSVKREIAKKGFDVDEEFVPEDERKDVRYCVMQILSNGKIPASTPFNASWPITVTVDRGGTAVHVRYDLIITVALKKALASGKVPKAKDFDRKVRPERLGEAGEDYPIFAAKPPADKRAALTQEFGLAGVIDGTATWTDAELTQVKAVYERLPAGGRQYLADVGLVRDKVDPVGKPGEPTTGLAHTGENKARDLSRKLPGTKHIHYYDAAFASNDFNAAGPPGSSGGGADLVIAHEVGHLVMFGKEEAYKAALNAKRRPDADVVSDYMTSLVNARTPDAQAEAWVTARDKAFTAIRDYAREEDPQKEPARYTAATDKLQELKRTGDALEATHRLRDVANRTLTLHTELLTAAERTSGGYGKNPVFDELARRFGFEKLTDYARRSDDPSDHFAETYALYVSDPVRLHRLNRKVYQWFKAGMPMDRAWMPPPDATR